MTILYIVEAKDKPVLWTKWDHDTNTAISHWLFGSVCQLIFPATAQTSGRGHHHSRLKQTNRNPWPIPKCDYFSNKFIYLYYEVGLARTSSWEEVCLYGGPCRITSGGSNHHGCMSGALFGWSTYESYRGSKMGWNHEGGRGRGIKSSPSFFFFLTRKHVLSSFT